MRSSSTSNYYSSKIASHRAQYEPIYAQNEDKENSFSALNTSIAQQTSTTSSRVPRLENLSTRNRSLSKQSQNLQKENTASQKQYALPSYDFALYPNIKDNFSKAPPPLEEATTKIAASITNQQQQSFNPYKHAIMLPPSSAFNLPPKTAVTPTALNSLRFPKQNFELIESNSLYSYAYSSSSSQHPTRAHRSLSNTNNYNSNYHSSNQNSNYNSNYNSNHNINYNSNYSSNHSSSSSNYNSNNSNLNVNSTNNNNNNYYSTSSQATSLSNGNSIPQPNWGTVVASQNNQSAVASSIPSGILSEHRLSTQNSFRPSDTILSRRSLNAVDSPDRSRIEKIKQTQKCKRAFEDSQSFEQEVQCNLKSLRELATRKEGTLKDCIQDLQNLYEKYSENNTQDNQKNQLYEITTNIANRSSSNLKQGFPQNNPVGVHLSPTPFSNNISSNKNHPNYNNNYNSHREYQQQQQHSNISLKEKEEQSQYQQEGIKKHNIFDFPPFEVDSTTAAKGDAQQQAIPELFYDEEDFLGRNQFNDEEEDEEDGIGSEQRRSSSSYYRETGGTHPFAFTYNH